MLTPNQKTIIDLLIEQEKLLAQLYAVFSEKFTEHGKFWKKLSREEHGHAKWLEQLYEAGEKDIVHFDEGRITPFSLGTFISGVKDAIHSAESEQMDQKAAFIRTADLERSLIEKNVFSCFNGLTDKAINALGFLEKQTQEHLAQAESLREKLQSS
jgi:rubrerythrin